MADNPMSYLELPPPPGLAPWVAALWCFEVRAGTAPREHHIPLTGGLLLSFGRDDELMLAGPRVEPLVTTVRGGEVFWGVHLLPGAAVSLFHLPPGSLRDQIGPARLWLDAGWCERLRPPPAAEDGIALLPRLAAVLEDLVPRAGPLDEAVMTTVHAILRSPGGRRLDELARAAALSPRQLRRRFQAAAGLSPKELVRLRRLRAVAAAAVLDDRPWLELVGDGGFADQPHLVREFQSLLGVSPGAFERHARRIDHQLVER